jgi:Putative MetA-pathway of phenol degradation
VNRRMARRLARRWLAGFFVLLVMAFLLDATASAGPPFLTDDPDPVPFRHYEAYLFSTVDRSADSRVLQVPAFEFNIGAAPNLQLHLVAPCVSLHPGGAYGIGDVEAGAKYRFVAEASRRPEIGIFPMLELPTGDSQRGLGNGRTWARLPLWVQKSAGPWTTYGGAGYIINRAPGMKDAFFAGWLVQRQITKRLTLGTEVFHQTATSVDAGQETFVDGGGYFQIAEGLDLLFMSGHSATGESHVIGYLGLYYTWGRS